MSVRTLVIIAGAYTIFAVIVALSTAAFAVLGFVEKSTVRIVFGILGVPAIIQAVVCVAIVTLRAIKKQFPFDE